MNLLLKINRIMKTQNTLENKARFFAQYFGQHVLYFSSDFLRKIDNLTLDSVENDDFLELKPLSQISDEDVIQGITYLYNITREALGEILEIEHYCTFSSITTIEIGCNFKTSRSIHHWSGTKKIGSFEADYFRSKGYALHYMDLSVEDLVEYGWVKLKEE